jgi:single-stranded-DNA-specific exonuclease
MNRDELSSHVPRGLWSEARRAANALMAARRVTIASHIDADGVSSAAVAKKCIDRRGVASEVRFFKKLDDEAIGSLASAEGHVVWFTDLGSGSVSKLEGMTCIVSDHHVPETYGPGSKKGGQALLTDFSSVIHVNPQINGISGATELSGAGSTFLVALALDEGNMDLIGLAILGAVGDLQDQKTRRLEGLNGVLADAAQEAGVLKKFDDIRYFGRETRPLHKMLEYSSDPFLPRITGNEEGAISFLLELGIELKDGDAWRSWAGLDERERRSILTALRDYLEQYRRRPEVIERLTGEVYTFANEPEGSPLRDAKEFSTLLNACGRHGKAVVGLKVCMGDRQDALAEGIALLRDHRSALSKALTWAKGSGVIRMKNIQFFDAADEIEDTIVGTVAGMLLGSEGADRTVPMVAFAESTEFSSAPKSKASARGTQELVSRGMDLSVAIRTAAERVGGVGGGHNIAAGATIPDDRKEEFLEILDQIVGSQLVSRGTRRG